MGGFGFGSLFVGLLVASIAAAQEPAPRKNRLAEESSPYLLLHAENPVEWYPWGEEAIARAREEGKPIFLSVGYSTCYWCHVMEEEVFSNPEIAELMNAGFVNIKVDREERPDLDEIYMTATQLLQRRGGWPNSVFLTPELKPFFAGTYFPPEDRPGITGFPTVLGRIRELWENDRERISASAERVTAAMREMIATRNAPSSELPSGELTRQAVVELKRSYDSEWGGFGRAPKFPSPSNFFLLWNAATHGDEEAREMVVSSLHRMAQGALYDHLGGGFHRYATDREWRVPHFEKMLYDNAFLAEIYATVARSESDEELALFARGTLDFVLGRLTEESGGFRSAIDAQTDGREGAYYVWSRQELESILTERELASFGPIFHFDAEPNFEDHFYTVHLTDSFGNHARQRQKTLGELRRLMEPALAKLRSKREEREFPLVDDKVLTDWNGMMIAAMARGGQSLEEPRYVRAAELAASFILAEAKSPDGRLMHSVRNGQAKVDAFLGDYAFFIRGLLALHRVTEDDRWLDEAERLAEEMEESLRDPDGGYFLTRPRPHLLFQPKGILDGAIPSANGIAIESLLELATLTGKGIYRERAVAALRAFASEFQQYPVAAKTMAVALTRYLRESGGDSTRAAATGGAAASPPAGSLDDLAESVVEAAVASMSSPSALGWRRFELRMRIEEGWHVNANPASAPYLIPTEVQGPVREVEYPEGRSFRFAFADAELSVYDGEILISGQLGEDATSLALRYQACDDQRCLSPVTKTLDLPE